MEQKNEYVVSFRDYLQKRHEEGKKNWLVLCAKFSSTPGNETEKARFCNENWVFFDGHTGNARHTFIGDVSNVEFWKFLSENFPGLLDYVADDYSCIDNNTNIIHHITVLLSKNGCVCLPLKKNSVFIYEAKSEFESEREFFVDLIDKKYDSQPFYIYSGGGTDLQTEFIDKIQKLNIDLSSNLYLHDIYTKILQGRQSRIQLYPIVDFSNPTFRYKYFLSTRCLNNSCDNDNEYKLMIEKLYSDETKNQILNFIYTYSLNWTHPTREYAEKNNVILNVETMYNYKLLLTKI